MKQRLLKLMVVASCLSFLFSWQLTAGAIESGRIPDINAYAAQQEVTEGELKFTNTPQLVDYSRVFDYDNLGSIGSYFNLEGFSSEYFIRLQFKEKTDVLNLNFSNSSSEWNPVTLPLDENNGLWVPIEYCNLNESDGRVNFNFAIESSVGDIVYSAEIYQTKDLSQEPLLSSEDLTIHFVLESQYPEMKLSSNRLTGELNTEIPFSLELKSGVFSGKQIRIEFNFNTYPAPPITLSGEGLVKSTSSDNKLSYYVDIQNFQSSVYNMSLLCEEEVNTSFDIRMISPDGIYFENIYANVLIPFNYSQSDLTALENIAKANPNSTELQDFIESGYYKKDWNSDDRRNVGVEWSPEAESRVSTFRVNDWERRIDVLDLSELDALNSVYISGTNIKTLNLSALSNLHHLQISDTYLKWEDVSFPVNPSVNLSFGGSTTIEAKGAVPLDENYAYASENTEIDLSEYAELQGEKSKFTWYKIVEKPYYNRTEVDMPKGDAEGKFKLQGEPGELFMCEISNPLRDSWVMQTLIIKISRSADSYSQQDIDGLKKLAADNPQVTQLQEFVDSKGWEHENWNAYRDVIRTDWSAGETARLTHLFIELDWAEKPDSISKLDLSAFTELKYFECERFMNISELDLSKNTKLETLHIYSRNLERIDVSMCPNLKELLFYTTTIHEWIDEYNSTKLRNINLSGCNQLQTLQIEHAHLTSLDLSGFNNLRMLYINNCQDLPSNCLDNVSSSLRYLSLAQTTQFQNFINNIPSTIEELLLDETEYKLPPKSVTGNLLRLGLPSNINNFDLNEFPRLNHLEVGRRWSVLKYSQIKNYRDIRYDGLSIINLKSASHPDEPNRFENGDTIDLSSEAVINGVETVFMWINNKYNTEEKNAFVPVEGRPGVFVLNSDEEEFGSYRCKIMNPKFCEITDINYYDGWVLETSEIFVETSRPSEYHQGDLGTIGRIVAESNNADLTDWWNNQGWQSDVATNVAQALWNNETPRRLVQLYLFGMGNSFAEYVDLSSLDKLEILSLARNDVKEVVLPENTTALESVMLPGTKVQKLIVAPYSSLRYLDVSETPLTACDVSNNNNLVELKLNGTAIEGVEKTAPEIAKQLTLYGVPANTESIDLNQFPKLEYLRPDMSKLRFSGVKNPRQLKEIDMDLYYPINYGSVRGGLTPYGETLSFAEEMSVAGQPSTILWRYSDVLTGIYTDLGTSESYTLTEEVGAGDFLNTVLTNPMFPGWVLDFGTIVYTCDGDANLDKKVNVADVTATVSYILNDKDNMINPFGFFEADVNYDDRVLIADVVGIVNIIQNRPVTKASELKDAYQPTVLLEVDDKGFLTMSSEVPVAGIQLAFTGAKEKLPLLGDAGRLAQGATLNGDTLRMVAYSMDGNTLPSGKRVIMKMTDNLKLIEASFADAEANTLKAEGDIVPTSTEAVKPQSQVEAIRNYPNPFSGSTTFSYSLSADANKVSVEIFTATGAMVSIIEGIPAGAGLNKYTTTVQLPSGVYYYRLSIDGENGKTVSPANVMIIR